MADLLIVEHEPDLVETLRTVCRTAGVSAEAVHDGAEALSSLDWHPPRVILCAGKLPDLWGWELCAVVRSDPKTARLPFVLLLDPEHLDMAEAQRCGATHLASRLAAAAVVAELLPRLLPSHVVGAPARASGAVLQGDISVVGLSDLAETIAGAGRTGALVISLEQGQGTLHFHGGRIVEAEFGASRGEAAVRELFDQSAQQAGNFAFLPTEGLPQGDAIRKSVSQLLLDVAMDLDTRRAHLIGDPPSPAN